MSEQEKESPSIVGALLVEGIPAIVGIVAVAATKKLIITIVDKKLNSSE